MEVLVAFLDGDPDRPVCVGCLYNGAHRPPYTLPAEKTKSTLRTQSTPDAAGYNELTFDDAAGAERVSVRAQRDLDAEVLRNLNTKIGARESRSVGGSRHTEIDRDDVTHVRRDEIRHTDGAQQLHVGGSVAMQVGGGPALGDAAAPIPGMSIEIIQGGYSLSAPQRIELRCGASTIVMTPTSIDIAAPVSTTVRCGGASVALSPAALGMLAPVLSIAAPGASLGLGSSASLSSAGGVKVGSSEDCELTLNGSATLCGSRVSIEGVSSFTASASRAEVTGFEEAVVSSDKAVRLSDGAATVVLEGGLLAVND